MTAAERVVRSALDDLDSAIGEGDPAALLSCCEPDVVFIGSGDGEEAVGHDALAAMLEAVSALAGDGGFAVEWDFVGGERHGDLVLATGFGWIRASGSLSRFDGARYRMTGVLRQSAERWRWRVYHASEPGTWS